MQYLKGFTKARLLGIAHEAYVAKCDSLGNDYNLENGTKYDYNLITHPVTGEHALEIGDTTFLPHPPFLSLLVEVEHMNLDGWGLIIKEPVTLEV
jgi:hypothetical protein